MFKQPKQLIIKLNAKLKNYIRKKNLIIFFKKKDEEEKNKLD